MSSRICVAVFSFATALLSACGNSPAPAVDAATCTTPGTTANLQACTSSTECASCLCQNFGHSMLCTKTCTGDADCPAPFGGCTNNVCRP